MTRPTLLVCGVVLVFLLGDPAATVLPAQPTTRSTRSTQPAHLEPGNHVRRLKADRRERSYRIHVPPNYDPATPTPVVLAFHGAYMNAAQMEMFSGLDETSDAAGFIVVYPNGTGPREGVFFFNAWTKSQLRGPADDVAFTAKVLDDLATVANVDAKRVFATGMSNGAMMCYRLAAELSDRIAAIAPVAGTVAVDESKPTRPVPVIHFHGSADKTVPLNGPGSRTPSFVTFKTLVETIELWRTLNGCPAEPTVDDLPDTSDDGTRVTRKTYGPGDGGAEVVLYLIENGGHTWPGRPAPLRAIGKSTTDISANDLMWEFFCKHPME